MNVFQDELLGKSSDKVCHGFFGRQGGVSEGFYASLNCGVGSNDDLNSVRENRRRVANFFGRGLETLNTVHQVHSADCVIIDTPINADQRPKADALVTEVPGLIVGVLTADCGPILYSGKKQDGSLVVGAAHAGWGGALKGVNERTVDQMLSLGAVKDTICAAIGPCIGPASYEVSKGFEEPFLDRSPEDERFFKETNKDQKLMFDLPGYIANRLAQYGIQNVSITGHDTFAMEAECFSYRRTTHRKEGDYGRQISAIMIAA